MQRLFIHRKLIVITLIAFLIGACAIMFVVDKREMPFDAAKWQAADPRMNSTRFRMSADVIKRIRNERWTPAATIEQLGQPATHYGASEALTQDRIALIYPLGVRNKLYPISFYLRIDFFNQQCVGTTILPE